MFDIKRYNLEAVKRLPPELRIKFANAVRIKMPPSLREFFEKTSPYKLEPWQIILAERLQKLRHQKGQRIRIHKPPQHGGSILLSQRLPAYLIGCDPSIAVRLVTYNETKSERFGSIIRNIMLSREFETMFPNGETQIPKGAAASEWSTSKRASYADGRSSFKGLGLQTGIVGTGGNLWIIDDPYKSREEAFSDTINEKMWWTWSEDISVRLAPDDNVIVMYHTYNERDFTARLKEQGGWEDIRIPAICDSEDDFCKRQIGEALSPRYPIEHLLKQRDGYTDKNGNRVAGLGEATFESLYQGNPKPRGGVIFKTEDFDFIEDNLWTKSEGSFFVRYWDTASSNSADADQTASFLWYKTPGGIFTGIDHTAGRYSPHQRDNFIRNTCQSDAEKYGNMATVLTYIEKPPGAGGEVIDSIINHCSGYAVFEDKVHRDKEDRAYPLAAQMQAQNVKFLKRDWNKDFMQEMLAFPNGKHDDRVDSATGGFNIAANLFY